MSQKIEREQLPCRLIAPIGLQHQGMKILLSATQIFDKNSLSQARVRVIPSPPGEFQSPHPAASYNSEKDVIHVGVSLFHLLLMPRLLPVLHEFVEEIRPLVLSIVTSKEAKSSNYYLVNTMLSQSLAELDKEVEEWEEIPQGQHQLDTEYDFASSVVDLYVRYLLSVIRVDESVEALSPELLKLLCPLAEIVDVYLAKKTLQEAKEYEDSAEHLPVKFRLVRLLGGDDCSEYDQQRSKALEHEFLHYLLRHKKDPELQELGHDFVFSDETIKRIVSEAEESGLHLVMNRDFRDDELAKLLKRFQEVKLAFSEITTNFSQRSMEFILYILPYLQEDKQHPIFAKSLAVGIEEVALALFNNREDNAFLKHILLYVEEKFIILPPMTVVMEIREILKENPSPEAFTDALIKKVLNIKRINKLTQEMIPAKK